MTKLLVMTVLFAVLGTNVWAQRVGLSLGLSQVQIEADASQDISSQSGGQAGALFYQPFSEMAQFRVGALLNQQSHVFTVGSSETTLNLTKLNIPMTMGFSVGERFLLFAGPVLGLTVSKTCTTTSGTCSVNSMKVAGTDLLFSLGAQILLTSEWAMDLSFDKLTGKPFEGASGASAINVNFQYIIE